MNSTQIQFVWPELANPWKKASQQFKTAFWSACFFGVITHIYVFTNLLLNHDSVWHIYFDNYSLASGRWILRALSDISTRFQMPVVIAVISVFMLALTAGITVSVLNISHKVAAVLTGAFIVTIPSVACIFSYMFTADAYFICLFMNAVAVYVAKKYSWGWFPAIILCASACGGYQAFICYAIGLFLMDCILELLTNRPVRDIVRKGFRYVFIVIFSLLLYYLVLLVLLKVNGESLTSYQGIDSMSLTNMEGFLSQIPKTYQDFIQYFRTSPYSTKFYQTVQVLFCALSFAALCYLAVIEKIYRDPLRLALLLAGCLLLPMALNFITILSAGGWVHALMIYSFVLLYVFMLKLIELALQRMITKGMSDWPIVHLAGILLAGLLIWNNFCVSNMAYLRLQLIYENSFALANRIAARIEELDGYAPELPVAVVGEASRSLYGGTVSEFSQINSLTGTTDRVLFSPEPHVRTRTFIEHYIGLHMPRPSQGQISMLKQSGVIETMPSYPQPGSVLLYDEVIIVKLSDGSIR